MLKRMSLALMLLVALVGIAGVQAQDAPAPQSAAAWLPADAEIMFAMRIDGEYLDTLSDVVNRVVAKFPADVTAQIPTVNLRQMLEMQVGQLEDTGLGGVVGVSLSNMGVLFDREVGNDDEVRAYFAAPVVDRAALESYVETRGNLTGEADGDWTRYMFAPEGYLFVGDTVAYITNQTEIALGQDALADDATFNETISQLPAPSYNIVAYIDYGAIMGAMMDMMPAQSMDAFNAMGLDFSQIGPIAMGATILDETSLVIDAYASSMPTMGMGGQVDPAFAANIPAEMSFVVHGTNLQAAADASLDSIVQSMAAQNAQQSLSREQIDGFFQGFFGISLEEDVISWMTGDYALMADFDMMPFLTQFQAGELDEFDVDPRFAFIVEGDGSDKPAAVAAALGNALVKQLEQESSPDNPQVTVTSADGTATVEIEGIVLSRQPELILDVTMIGDGERLIIGDAATVATILSGDFADISSAPGFTEAAAYILPNSYSIAYAGGEGWGDLMVLGGLGSLTTSANPSQNDTEMMGGVLTALYDIVSSSSISAVVGEDGSQFSRLVLTLAD